MSRIARLGLTVSLLVPLPLLLFGNTQSVQGNAAREDAREPAVEVEVKVVEPRIILRDDFDKALATLKEQSTRRDALRVFHPPKDFLRRLDTCSLWTGFRPSSPVDKDGATHIDRELLRSDVSNYQRIGKKMEKLNVARVEVRLFRDSPSFDSQELIDLLESDIQDSPSNDSGKGNRAGTTLRRDLERSFLKDPSNRFR